jgi:predicted HicB family RNase H-like nuclease
MYRGYTPLLWPEDGGWNGRIAGIRAVETFEGPTYEAALEDFRKAVDFYMETEQNPETPFTGQITLQITPELHEKLFHKAQKESSPLDAWLKKEIARAVLHA